MCSYAGIVIELTGTGITMVVPDGMVLLRVQAKVQMVMHVMVWAC